MAEEQTPAGHGGRSIFEAARVRVAPATTEARLQSLTDASRAIAGARDVEELVQVVTEAARAIVGTHQAVTSRLVRGWTEATTHVSLSDKYAEYRDYDEPPRGLGVPDAVIRENAPLRLTGEELARHPDFRELCDAPGHPPLPDYLAAPLISRLGENIGLIQLSDKVDGTPFTAEDEMLLAQLALMTSSAIEHVETATELEARIRNARLAAATGMAFTIDAPLEEKLTRCAQAMVDELGAAFARIWTLDEPGDVLVLRASAGMYTHLDGAHARVPVGAYKIGRIAEELAPHLTNEVVGDERVHDQEWARREGMVSFAGYPLVLGGRCVGVLAMFARHRLPDATLDTLASVADSIAVGIEQVRSAEAVARESRIVESLHEVGRITASQLDLDEIVQVVTDAATTLTGAQFGAFFYNVVDERGEAFQLYTLSGVPREAFAGFPMPRNTEVFGPTFAGEAVVRLHDVTADRRYGRNPPYHGMPEGHLAVRSYLAVPVRLRGGEVVGGLFFGHEEPGRFGEEEERLAIGIAASAAIAIENARLYEAAQREVRAREAALEVREQALAEVRRQSSRLRHVAEVAAQLNALASIDEILALLTRAARDVVGAHQAETSLAVAGGWAQSVTTVSLSERYAAWRDYDEPRDGSGIYAWVCETQQPVRMTQEELERHPRWRGFGSEAGRHPRMRGWLAAPLVSPDGETLGLVQLSDRFEGEFSDEDLLVLVQLAGIASSAIHKTRLYEDRARIVEALQRPLQPPELPDVPGVELAACYRPYGEELAVGGDFYDVFELFDGEWAVAVGDVCGKGPEAAAMTSLARHSLWAAGRRSTDPVDILALVNEAVLREGSDRFCTVTVATLDTSGDDLVVHIASGGHPDPILVRADGRVETVECRGRALGILPELDVGSTVLVLRPGDAIVLHTDGLVEGGGGGPAFEDGEVLEVLGRMAGRSAAEIVDGIVAEAQERDELIRDDLAALVIRRPLPG